MFSNKNTLHSLKEEKIIFNTYLNIVSFVSLLPIMIIWLTSSILLALTKSKSGVCLQTWPFPLLFGLFKSTSNHIVNLDFPQI